MSLDGKIIERIDESDLQLLVDNQVIEGKSIDYKRDPIGISDRDKKEFLYDISSFANASGGHMVIGIEEDKGLPTKVLGLEIADIDAEKSRLDNMILSGIKPRMVPSPQIHIVKLSKIQKEIIVIRISKSIAAPHMVTFKDTNKFYSRNSHGKYLLDVGEIRNLFVISESAIDRIRNFRTERLARIGTGETPVTLEDHPKMVMHIVPMSISDPSAIFDLTSVINKNIELLEPVARQGLNSRLNFDGYLDYLRVPKGANAYSYVQLFRNGSIEFVEAYTLRIRWEDIGKVIPSIKFEQDLVYALRRYLFILRTLNVNPPFFVMISLLGVKGYTMAVDKSKYYDEVPPRDGIDRNDLILPEIVLHSTYVDAPKILKESFDIIWNAAGWPASENYDKDGAWTSEQNNR
jgi:hypothetical protein